MQTYFEGFHMCIMINKIICDMNFSMHIRMLRGRDSLFPLDWSSLILTSANWKKEKKMSRVLLRRNKSKHTWLTNSINLVEIRLLTLFYQLYFYIWQELICSQNAFYQQIQSKSLKSSLSVLTVTTITTKSCCQIVFW